MSTPATDSLTTIGEAVGLTREDMTAIWEGVKANQAKLDGCQRHDFVGIDAGERYGSLRFKVKFRCKRCQGTVDASAMRWYQRGLEHAR